MVDIERVVTLDELMDRVPEQLVRDAESRRSELETSNESSEENMSKEVSKARRIRDYVDSHPEARNKDVVEALVSYGVTAADVANVKSQQKRREGKVKKTATAKAKATAASSDDSNSSTALTNSGPTINWRELDAGVAFVKAAGSIQRAQHLLIIIEQIKAC